MFVSVCCVCVVCVVCVCVFFGVVLFNNIVGLCFVDVLNVIVCLCVLVCYVSAFLVATLLLCGSMWCCCVCVPFACVFLVRLLSFCFVCSSA